jgi:hypothetical protein
MARNLISHTVPMKAGTHQTDSLPCIVIVGGGRGLGDAAEPGTEDGEVNIRRLHLSTPMPAAALSGGDKQPGTHSIK